MTMRTNRLTALALAGLLTAFTGAAMAGSTGPTNPVNPNATKLPGTDAAPTTDRNSSNTQGAKTTPRESGTDVQHGSDHGKTGHDNHGTSTPKATTTPSGKPVVE
ncbi:hypothetical protein NJC38_03415 [Pseudomonas sp. 21LCFQ010]|uniref:hypothetical protein n=1 Tax=Pseudomonas sp. 21LCFQ010 TaxID=2957506 RepID=UPI002096F2FA|nr:hypothetical protein [Pseudomonas sp. 21LCFQ010]MCO8161200.1 hypothetical protein [Pseudomonas sp. 21LCFQ010]